MTRCVHVAPLKQLSDNGGEFNDNDVRDMAENFNTEVKTTAAYGPWSNGLLEEHNQELPEIKMSRQVTAASGTLQWTGLLWQRTHFWLQYNTPCCAF